MKVLLVAAPLQGHLLPMIPLARACRDAGHDVLIASGADALGIDLEGLWSADVAPGFRFGRIALRVLLRHPLIARRELTGRAGVAMVGELFGAANARFADAVVALAERERPDLIVYEPLGAAGALAAGHIGVPSVLMENSLYAAPELLAAVAASRPMLKRTVPAPDAAITISPPSVVGPRPGLQVRPVPYSGGGELPDWLSRPGDRPRIVVSRSTVPGPGGGDPVAAVLTAAPRVDAEIVLVRPSNAVLSGTLPPNVRTVGRVPLDRVIPHAAGFVHHGGAGSTLGALAAGVPQLAVPGAGDRRHNAELIARRGAGLAVDAQAISGPILQRLIGDEEIRAAAAEVREEIDAMPEPATIVPKLTALAGR